MHEVKVNINIYTYTYKYTYTYMYTSAWKSAVFQRQSCVIMKKERNHLEYDAQLFL